MAISRRRLVPALVVPIAVAAICSTALPALAGPSHPTSASVALAPLPSVIPGWATTSKVLGATPGNQTVYVLLTLRGKDVAGEKAYGTAASTPGNPLYHQWLTKAQFQQRFAPDAVVGETVAATLKTLGVSNVVIDKMGTSVLATLPASLASTIFNVRFQQVMHAGTSTRVALNQPTLPAGLSPFVSVVSGLSEDKVHLGSTVKTPVPASAVKTVSAPAVTTPALPVGGAPPAYFNASPASTFYGSTVPTGTGAFNGTSGQKTPARVPTYPVLAGDTSTVKPYVTSGYTPPQIRGAYDVDKVTQTGKGVTVGVVLFFDGQDVSSDLATFSTAFGLAAPNYTDLSPETAGGSVAGPELDAEGEQTLDVEAIHQMAPDAKIIYSGAAAPVDPTIDVAEVTAIEGGANVINNSFGGTGDVDSSDQTAFAAVTDMAKSMGVGIDFSSGDAGDNVVAGNGREADAPSTSDGVTAVGGTGIEIGRNNDYEGEFYWGTYSTPAAKVGDTAWGQLASQAGGAGGGGGVSTSYAEPAWQKGVVPVGETTNSDTAADYLAANGSAAAFAVPGAPGRVVPDVAMIADSTTGILVGETQVPDTTDGTTSNQLPAYSYYRIGGTSVSSPIFTGMMALVDQALLDNGKGVAGFVNPTIYPFEAKNDGSFRDPTIGRATGTTREASTEAQILTGCSGTVAGGDLANCPSDLANDGPGSVPVVAEVRSDFTDGANNGLAQPNPAVQLPPVGGLPVAAPTVPVFVAGNPVITKLRGQGILGTLEDRPGYDDSTGLGSPDAPQYIADFLATAAVTPPASLPEVADPALLVLAGGLLGGGALVIRRRRRGASA